MDRYFELIGTNALTFENVEARILKFLKFRSENNSIKALQLTHQEIGEIAGIPRVVVSIILKNPRNGT